nr:immunoglobulin light chain junction region [Macaca mulatta]
RMQALQLPLTF